MTPAPKLKFNEMLDDLNEIASHTDTTPYQFKLNRYKQDTKKMLISDPVYSHMILGIIATIEGDIEAMHTHHQAAIRLSDGDSLIIYQYCSSLIRLALFEEAREQAEAVYKKNPQDTKIIECLITCAFFTGDNESYDQYKEELKAQGIDYGKNPVFPEDVPGMLVKLCKTADQMLKEDPENIVLPDPELESLVDELIEGVEID